MNGFSIAIASLALAAGAMPAMAQSSWRSINQRQVTLDARIDQGVRSGALNRNEAVRLRTQFSGLVRLEAQYRRSNGLNRAERLDLDRRFDTLSQRVRVQKNDRQVRR